MFKSTAALVFLLGAVCSQPARHDDRPAPASVIKQLFYIFGPPPSKEGEGARGAFAPPPGPGPKPPGPKPPGPKPPGPKPPGPGPDSSCSALTDYKGYACKNFTHYCGIDSDNGKGMDEYCPKTCCENKEDLGRCNKPADTQSWCHEYISKYIKDGCKTDKELQKLCPTSCGCPSSGAGG